MNTPTKRIFYLFGTKFVKNEPQTKVWGSLTCKSQCSQPVARMFALFALVAVQRCYLTPAFFLARSIAAICSSESLMEP